MKIIIKEIINIFNNNVASFHNIIILYLNDKWKYVVLRAQ